MCAIMHLVFVALWLGSARAWESFDDVHNSSAEGLQSLRGSSKAQPAGVVEAEERSLAAACSGLDDFMGKKDCGSNVVGSFKGLVKIIGKAVNGGGWGESKDQMQAFADVVQGLLEVAVPFPFTMLSQVFFPALKGYLGVAMDQPAATTPNSYVTLKRLFRRKMRSNQVRIDALKEEVQWFDGLFLNSSFMNQGLYEAAGLSWLLNIQHDLVLDQELFFGAECLMVDDTTNFRQIAADKCSDYDDKTIIDSRYCEYAATVLGLDDHSAEQISHADKPHGCYTYQGGLYLNTHAGSTGNGATTERQALCTSLETAVLNECKVWQEAGTWELGAMYAIVNLGVLGDIVENFPDLKNTTKKRVAQLTDKYIRLLSNSFETFKKHRSSFFRDPTVSANLVDAIWCRGPGGPFWQGRYVREGRDYFYQVVRPGEKPEDAKCRGDCDVMATVCNVRPESGSGKYCVNEPAKWERAHECFDKYKQETEDEMTTKFNDLIAEFTDLHSSVMDV